MNITSGINIFESLHYAFINKALISGIFIALSCSFLGIFLILRRFSLIGDGLAHVSLATIALGLLIGTSPLYISIPLVMLASLGILKLAEKTTMHGDTAIGIVSSVSIALATIFASLAGGFNVHLFSYLFGSINTIEGADVYIAIIMSLSVIFIIIMYYHDLFALTFDEEFATASGVRTKWINQILILLTAITVVLGIRVVGVMLVSSLIIFPGATALQLGKSFKSTIIFAAFFGVCAVILGITISLIINLPTGGTIVMVNFLCFIGVFVVSKLR